MIDRFNFYDIYGYLLPGIILLGLFLAPVALSRAQLPSLEWTSAIVVVIAAYVTGHVIQAVGRNLLPSTVNAPHGAPRFPSEVLLEDGDPTIPQFVKARLRAIVLRDFGIDWSDRGQRQSFFNACRQALQASGTPSYAEQFEGLYAMMRGVSLAAAASIPEYLGWLYGSWVGRPGTVWFLGAAVAAALGWFVCAVFPRWISKHPQAGFAFLLAFLIEIGLVGGTVAKLSFGRGLALAVAVPILGIVVSVALNAYRFYAIRFAQTVYEGYYVRVAVK